MPAPKKDTRTLGTMSALLMKGPVSVFELTCKLKVSERTVYRYLKHIDGVLLNGHELVRSGSRPVRYWIPN